MAPEQELVKAYLFLRTACSAVTHFKLEVIARHDYKSSTANFGRRIAYARMMYLDKQERDLEMWQERLLDGQVGIVEWAAIRAMSGTRLPPEILSMIRDLLKPC